MEGSEVVKREPGSPLSPAETNLLGTSIHEPITWIYHDIEDDEEMLSSGRFGLDSGRKNPAIRYRQPRPLRKMEAFHSQKLWQYAADIWECIDYLLAPARRDFSNREHPERWEAQWQKTRNLLGDRTVTWIEVVGTPDNGPCACCIKSGSVCALPLASDGIYQVHVTCVIRRKTCDLNIAKPNNKSRKRPGDTNDTPAEDSPAVRRPRQKGAIEVIVPTRRHSLTGTGAIRTGSTAEAAELAGRAEEVMLLKQPHLHAVWQALEKGCMNKTPPYEQRGAKMLDMMLDTHNHWGVLRSYKGSKERRCICRKKLGQDCIVQIMRSSTASGALQAGERVTITKCLKCQAAGLDACDVDGARILTVPENDPRDASKGAVRNRRRITIGASVTDGQAAPSHPSADAPAASVPDIDREQMSAPITSHVSRSTTPAGPPQVTTLATPPMSAAAAPVNSNAALLPIPALIPVRNAAEAEERRQSLDRFLQYAANMFGHDKNRPADGNPIVDVNLAWDIGDALRRMKKLEDDPTNVDLMKETQTWTETAVDSVERHVVKLSRERGQRDLRTVSRYKDAQADLAAWKLASGM